MVSQTVSQIPGLTYVNYRGIPVKHIDPKGLWSFRRVYRV